MKRRADVQRYIHILSKLLGFSLGPKCRRAQKKTACLVARRSGSKTVVTAQSAPLGWSTVRCAMEMLRASGPKTIRKINAAATIPTTSISA
jgi:hypothetical protein